MPLVSVVIPTRGRPALLVRAVESVLAQTVADLEIVVMVDGPDPLTVERLRAIDDGRLRFYVNPAPVGAGSARNLGAAHATGAWIGFLDDDDEWLPTKLERQLVLGGPATGRTILTCRSAYVTPSGTSARPREIYRGEMPFDEWLFDRRRLFGGQSFIQTSSLLMPLALFREFDFPSHGQHEDWEIVIVALKRHGAELVTAPEILVRHHAEDRRPSLSFSGRIDGSLCWLETMRGIISARAFSGFCLTVVAHRAASDGGWRDCFRLLRLAFRHGRPTFLQLLVFSMVWLFPRRLHALLRRLRPARSGEVVTNKRWGTSDAC